MKDFVTLPRLKKGDLVAVVSPSNGLPELFPWVQDLGIKRLNEDFGLRTKEYSTTRKMGSGLEDRARDLQAAFSDPDVKAVFTSIGGDDQIQLIHLLDENVFLNNPKPFFGYSDNTHLANYLWKLGIPSYYGGCIMTQFAMGKKMHDLTTKYLKWAMFDGGPIELEAADLFCDEDIDWADKTSLSKDRKHEKSQGWSWDGNASGSGRLWGGCVESLIGQVSAGRFLPDDESLKGTVLFLETAEAPEHWTVQYLLVGFGERGWLKNFCGVLVGRPKAWTFDKPMSANKKDDYKKKQAETILSTVRQYNKGIPVVQNIDFGHTDPQIPLPFGRIVELDSAKQTIRVN